MFFDPARYFPYEIVQSILSHLQPKDLLSASAVSHLWRAHTQDEELWRGCFKREGWRVDEASVREYESGAREKGSRYIARMQGLGVERMHRKDSRKRRREEAFSEGEIATRHPEYDLDSPEDSGDDMEGVEKTSPAQMVATLASHPPAETVPMSPERRRASALERRRSSVASDLSVSTANEFMLQTNFRLRPSVLQRPKDPSNKASAPKLSWAYIYKQRRLLERNWDNGNYQMFRLPHPKFDDEGHDECVYTIQHIGSILVSGSRDKTIRRWNLDTCRLIGKPLRAHEASVLCLQFDPSPENDIIVSGGSDSWVIIWRYSTGEVIKKMTTAHTESVLNLRFDDRYIVTCSKDKTIKIWNRREMTSDDPLLPIHVVQRFAGPTAEAMIKEHTLLATLSGHHAAVNAVMIHGDTIVSASGDRYIKNWSIRSGKCERNYTGHQKGIACVQYDGRRVVSGSSDNTVRIFDADRQAELACLTGHDNLVRTVQARFGDLEIHTDAELEEEARAADRKWHRAVASGMTPASASRRSVRNPGSSRPDDVLTVGAKVPHGGGGSRWARIVSGSYDETVIIWKKDHDGRWTAKHRLQQDMLRSRNRGGRQAGHAPPSSQIAHHAQHGQNANAQAAPHGPAPAAAHATAAHGPSMAQQAAQQLSSQVNALSSLPGVAPALIHANAHYQAQLAQLAGSQVGGGAAAAGHTHAHPPQGHQVPAQVSAAGSVTGSAAGPVPAPAPVQNANATSQQITVTQSQPGALNQQQQQQTTTQSHVTTQQHTTMQPQAPTQPHDPAVPQPHTRESNRVFKLQFDTRRIVCCSQNKTIVGWDFACGNEELARVGGWCEETY